MVSTREAGRHPSKKQRPENCRLYKGELDNTTLKAEARKLLSLQERQVDITPKGRGQKTVVSTREAGRQHHSTRQRPENCGLYNYKRGR